MTAASLKILQYPAFAQEKVKTLFFRTNAQVDYEHGSCRFQENQILSTNTIFNSLDVAFLRAHSTVAHIGLDIKLKGAFRLELLAASGPRNEDTICVADLNVVGDDASEWQSLPLSLEIASLRSELFLRLTAQTNKSQFTTARFTTQSAPARERVKVNCVICTYNREEYIENIYNAIRDNPDVFPSSQIHFTIVDNGQNLKFANTDTVTFCPNPNTGGSGGFTRGMLETRKGDFTHMVLMDDDIMFQVPMFADMLSYLRFVSPKTVMGAGMIRLDDDMRFLHERGATLREGFLALSRTASRNKDCHAYDTAFLKDPTTHAPWWWACFPVEALEDAGYSYPFFIKLDDAEYSYRLREKGYSIVFPGGFYIWHSPMEEKYSAKIGYYGHRNSWIFSTLSGHRYDVKQFSRDYIKAMMAFIADGKYEHADVLHKALCDFLKGPKFIAENAILLNKELGALVQNEAFQKMDVSGLPQAEIEQSAKAKWVRRLTLQGYWAVGRGSAYVDVLTPQPKSCKFLKRRISYYNRIFGVGYTVERSLSKTIAKTFRMVADIARIQRHLIRSVNAYQETKSEYVSAEYWETLLKDASKG